MKNEDGLHDRRRWVGQSRLPLSCKWLVACRTALLGVFVLCKTLSIVVYQPGQIKRAREWVPCDPQRKGRVWEEVGHG